MENFLGSLQSLAIYIGVITLGIFVGSRQCIRERNMAWTGPVQTIALILLIGCLGVSIGSNEDVVSSLGTIGVSAFIVTITSILGSILAVFVVRKFLKLDREGRSKKGDE